MKRTSRTLVAALATAGLLTLAACGGDDGGGDEGDSAGGEVEVFTWWAEGSEKEGLDALVGVFSDQNPDFEFVNGAVAGGAGSDAKNVLASRLQTNDPPATFQAHAGAELSDYIDQGQIEGLSAMYDEKGWSELFPEGLLERLEGEGLSGVVLFDPFYVLYYAGFAFAPTERPIALVLAADGTRTLVVPRLEVEHAETKAALDRVEQYDEYPGEPRAETVLERVLADAAEAADAPVDYVRALRGRPCRSTGL